MTKLFVFVGIPGSGKSTLAVRYAEEYDALILSSDALRKELYGNEDDQNHNGEVFAQLQQRTIEALRSGKNVIYDATNISVKSRKAILNKIRDLDCEAICVEVITPIGECIRRNDLRERVVPHSVIRRMAHQKQKPTLEEGFVKIIEEIN